MSRTPTVVDIQSTSTPYKQTMTFELANGAKPLLFYQQQYANIKTVRDYFCWMDTYEQLIKDLGPDIYKIGELAADKTLAPVVREYKMAHVATVAAPDLTELAARILEDNTHITSSSSSFESNYLGGEHAMQKSAGFDSVTHSIVDPVKYPELWNIAQAFDLEHCAIAIQYQPTACVFPAHIDTMLTMWRRIAAKDPDILDLSFDAATKSIKGMTSIRLLLALTDYVPGHVFGVDDQYWTNWKIGDAVAFDNCNRMHYTANTAWVPRAFLRISGIVNNASDHWIIDNINNRQVTQIQL